MLIVLLPITTICVAVLGIYVWYQQLVRKRYFEIAEGALSAFSRAEAALIYARNPATAICEAKSRERADGELPWQSEMLDTLFIAVERLKQHDPAFDELERSAFAVEVHFGEAVAFKVREPLRAYNRIAMAAIWQMRLVGMSGGECHQLRQRLATVVHPCSIAAGPGGDRCSATDELGAELTNAKSDVEAALRPWLTTPTLGEFLLVSKLLVLAQRIAIRLASIVWRRQPRRYGKIAVYAQLPLAGGFQMPDV